MRHELPGSGKAERRGGVLRTLLTVVVLVLVGFLAVSSLLFVWPASDQPRHVDAILSLNGGDEASRERLAVHLAERGYARVLLFSLGNSDSTRCPYVSHVRVVCFVAHPARTAGEVEFAADYLRRRHWDSVIVVPGRPQTTRARLLMKRCFAGRILMVPASVDVSQLPYDTFYEWGALAKALLIDRHC